MWGGEQPMRQAIDKTAIQQGTLINRDFLMAIQGFDNITTSINPDGSINQITENGDLKTIKFQNGEIISILFGEKPITKTITVANNQILEVLS